MNSQATPGRAEQLVYRCAPTLVWVRDEGHVIVVDAQNARSWLLDGIEAAIWDWVTMGYSYPRIVNLASLILKGSQAQAETQLEETLHRWHRAGLVQLEGNT